MKKSNILIYLMIIISIVLCVPSVIYLVNNKTVEGFDAYWTYTLTKSNNMQIGLISGIIVISLLIIFSILYLILIKKEKKIFKNKKELIIFILIISSIFTIILPYTSSDIYYYIGDSWLSAEYNQNPYYTSVADLQEEGINDEILENTGYWKNTTSIYGPMWNNIAFMLVKLSFGSLTAALYVFKIASLIIHGLNIFLIYKITKSRKYMIIYGLNPLVLMDLLSNVHNDIYLIAFILLSLYFLIRKKNIYLSLIFLAISVSIKYSTILLVPFILLYCFRDKDILSKLLKCFICGIGIIGIVVLLYLPYYKDPTIFTNMLVQGNKYSQSILFYLKNEATPQIYNSANTLALPAFAIIYITSIFTELFNKNAKISKLLKSYNFMSLVFIFIVLTTFQKWYILWILPTIIWQNRYMRKFILYLTITSIIPSLNYFITEGDRWIFGYSYSLNILLISVTLLLINNIICRYKKTNKRREKI